MSTGHTSVSLAASSASAAAGEGGGDLRGDAPGARHPPHRARRVGLGGVGGRPADAAHLDHVGDDDPDAVGADDARAAHRGQLDHLGDVAARDALGHDHDQLDAVLDRLEHSVLGEGGGDGDDRAVDRAAVVVHRLGDGVEHRYAVDVAAAASRGDPADDLGPGAVVQALSREVHRLAAGDALDDEV